MYAQKSSTVDAKRAKAVRAAVEQRAGRLLEFYVCGSSATFDLDIYRGVPVLIHVPDGIKDYDYDTSAGIDYIREDKRLYILPGKNVDTSKPYSTRIWSHGGFEFSAHMTVIDKMPMHSNITVEHIPKSERRPSERNPCDLVANRSVNRLRIRAAGRHGKQTETVVGIPEIDHVSRAGDGPDVNLSLAEWDEGHMVIDVAAVNPDFEQATLTHVEATDKHGKQLQSELWPWPDPNEPSAGNGSSSLKIMGGKTAHASVVVRDIDDHSMESLQFKFHGLKGGAPFVTAVKVYRMVPVTEDDTKPKPPLDPRTKHLTVSLRGSYGAFWIPDNRPSQNGVLKPTSTVGFALRIGKGLSPYLAIEGELAGGTTGVAEFEPGMDRSGSYGRVVVQGVARYGKEWIGSVRLGTGLQVANYESSQLDVAGINVDALYALGFGLQRRIRDFGLGVQFFYIQAVDTGARDMVIGLHAGYGWTL